MNFVAYNNKISYEELIAIHEQYNDATRAVGRELNVPVIDMDAIYRDNPDVRLFIESDVPHASQWGQHLEADVLYRALVARGIASPPGGEANRRRQPRTSSAAGGRPPRAHAARAAGVMARAARARPPRP